MAETALANFRLFIHRPPTADGSAQAGSSALDEGRARRLLEHLRNDWPAMDVVLASKSGSSTSNDTAGLVAAGRARCGKGRAWGERPSEVERLKASGPPPRVLADALPAASTTSAPAVAEPSATPSISGSSARLKRKRKVERPALDNGDHRPGVGRCFGVLPLVRPSAPARSAPDDSRPVILIMDSAPPTYRFGSRTSIMSESITSPTLPSSPSSSPLSSSRPRPPSALPRPAVCAASGSSPFMDPFSAAWSRAAAG